MKPDNWGTSNQKPIEGVCTQYMSSFFLNEDQWDENDEIGMNKKPGGRYNMI